MKDVAGRTAVVTGAASGIGLGMARTFAKHGMRVVLSDIHGERLEAALANVRGLGAKAIAVPADVSRRAEVQKIADAALNEFGAIHVACNNAGITIHGKSVWEVTPEEWDWISGVNLHGVMHGIQIFLPIIRSHGGDGHMVNTASIAGFQVAPHRRSGCYAATKFAVVALTESLWNDLKETPVGVSVLAPAAVKTRIYQSTEARPERFGGPEAAVPNPLQKELDFGLEPDVVGDRVLRAIRDRELYIFTHMQTKEWLLARHQRIISAFDACEAWIAEDPTERDAQRIG
ncbi:MAG: SDR family NAD(P)-dependent oxidoreductase [Bradyrhizobiaceae bacterium]|nr:SDR family NAD(P)-dependent oxidoreductase [Bradyrhizobiaceae bacterium]